MNSEKFTLSSGAVLTVTMAPFALAVRLKEAVDKVMLSIDKTWDEGDPRVGYLVMADEAVRNALFPVMDTVMYDVHRVTESLFNDPKMGVQARGDYHEIAAKVIQVNRGPFFLKTSSSSTTSQPVNTASPESQ